MIKKIMPIIKVSKVGTANNRKKRSSVGSKSAALTVGNMARRVRARGTPKPKVTAAAFKIYFKRPCLRSTRKLNLLKNLNIMIPTKSQGQDARPDTIFTAL